MIEELLEYNRAFVEQKGYEKYLTNKYPDKKIAIVTCMDIWGIQRSGFFNGRGKWAKGFENQRV